MISKEQPTYLSTGELSKLLNISVRTIRYYDQIGLVEPSKKRQVENGSIPKKIS